MSLKHSIPLAVGVGLALAIAAVIATAMFAVDQGEEMLHLYKEIKGTQNKRAANGLSNASPMELHAHWRDMTLADVKGESARKLGINGALFGDGGLVVAGFTGKNGVAARGGLRQGDVITGINRRPIEGLANLHRVAQTTNSGVPTLVDVNRRGQTVTLVLPPKQLNQAMPAAFNGPQLYCPRDGILVPGGMTQGRQAICPRCKGPLHMYQPNAAGGGIAGVGNFGAANAAGAVPGWPR